MKKILILAANPRNTDRLRLDEEVREITDVLEHSKSGQPFQIIQCWAVRVNDLQEKLLDHRPHLIHFSGHGGGSQGLALENDLGQMQLVTSSALAGLFKFLKGDLECVFLNACYSEDQAKAIYRHIDHVVGMNHKIGDRAAIEFAKGFYRGVGAQMAYKDAFALGKNQIDLQSIPESSTPVLKARIQTRRQAAKPSRPSPQPPPTSPPSAAAQIFISYRSQAPDIDLAQEFHDALKAAGHNVFMASKSIRLGENWPQRIDAELKQADYFLLLLSHQSVTSEMVTEEVRQAKHLQDTRQDGRPVILPIRVNLPMDVPLNYDLRGYLQRIQQGQWESPADTPQLLGDILELIAEGKPQLPVQALEPIAPPLEIPDHPPLPVAEPELPGGQVDLASPFYIERPNIDSRCFEAIVKPGALIRVKAPRQMGKTSLMARTLHHAEMQGCLKVPLSFQIADGKIFTDLDQFLKWFCASVGRRLRLPNKLSDYWDDFFGSKDNCTAYFEEYLLAEIDQPLALGLDEVDLVFQYPDIASDFFGLLRAWHEDGKSRDIWKKLRLIVVHSTEVYIPLNINQSPFNVGLPIDLPEFTLPQIADLAHRHGLADTAEHLVPLEEMIGGHPYLVRVALYNLARQDMTMADLLANAPTEAGPYGDHLRRHLWNLEQRPELVEAVKRIVASSTPVRLESVQAFQLRSMGLVNLQGNDVTPRCELYRQYFKDRLGVR
ncbi:AAA-like domain-containing protein [Phormidium tenue]|uniref:TIR domain-containing protein n=1 Tax=Phormidium tenue NIES-30 TaxID=549789 RepID=A0A1U7J5E4_9CYAN|nr:AAA-like domain-containing protein [Phormidium tenue]MBD2232505.1 AAA-like domain-containing protein [Phormidium tenue FACHB-1052]OKH48017.1 hypothetical protein NIES30_10940 [Phormidium tenue NIES-30]